MNSKRLHVLAKEISSTYVHYFWTAILNVGMYYSPPLFLAVVKDIHLKIVFRTRFYEGPKCWYLGLTGSTDNIWIWGFFLGGGFQNYMGSNMPYGRLFFHNEWCCLCTKDPQSFKQIGSMCSVVWASEKGTASHPTRPCVSYGRKNQRNL